MDATLVASNAAFDVNTKDAYDAGMSTLLLNTSPEGMTFEGYQERLKDASYLGDLMFWWDADGRIRLYPQRFTFLQRNLFSRLEAVAPFVSPGNANEPAYIIIAADMSAPRTFIFEDGEFIIGQISVSPAV